MLIFKHIFPKIANQAAWRGLQILPGAFDFFYLN